MILSAYIIFILSPIFKVKIINFIEQTLTVYIKSHYPCQNDVDSGLDGKYEVNVLGHGNPKVERNVLYCAFSTARGESETVTPIV